MCIFILQKFLEQVLNIMGEVGGVGQVFALGNYVPGNRTSRLATLLDPDFTYPEFHVLENLTYFPCQNHKTSKQFG